MTGFEQFVKMQEIDRHLRSEAQWWRGEGVSAANLAIVFRSLARLMDDVPPSPETRQNTGETWDEQWTRTSPHYQRSVK